jgi:predicted thioredoxin/glutaredoxin
MTLQTFWGKTEKDFEKLPEVEEVYREWLERLAVPHGSDWRREVFLLDRRYIPETMLAQVQGKEIKRSADGHTTTAR